MFSASIRDRVGQVAIAGLYVFLLARAIVDWFQNHRLTGLIAAIGFSLFTFFTIRRAPLQHADRSLLARLATATATFAPFAFRFSVARSPLPDWLTGLFSLVGTIIVWGGLLTLRRNFGLLPAVRGGVAEHGFYRIVRHPLYAGYIWLHGALVLGYPSWWNFAVWICAEGSQLIRLRQEERILSADDRYRAYAKRVRWRLIPGIF